MDTRTLSVVGVFIAGVCLAASARSTYSRQPDQVEPPAPSLPGPPQKPTKNAHIHGMDLHGKTDFRDVWNGAHLVVDAVVMELVPADEPIPGGPPQMLIATTYKLLVLEAFKVDGRWKSDDRTVLVTRIGGVRDQGDYILRKFDPRFPLFEKDERYILFLKILRRNEYAPAFGPDSAFQVTSGRINPLGKNALSTQIGALSIHGFRNTLLNQERK